MVATCAMAVLLVLVAPTASGAPSGIAPALAPYAQEEEPGGAGGAALETPPAEEKPGEDDEGAEKGAKGDKVKAEEFDIEYYVKLAQENHPSIMAAKWELESYRKQLSEAHWAPYFNIDFSTMFTPMSRLEGDALHSPQGEFDISTDMGIWVKMELTAGIPVYTFGKITSYWEMAEQGVKVGENKVKQEKQRIAFDVRRAFYSLQIAREILHVTEGGTKYLDKALDKVEEDLDADEGNYTESDLKKLQTGKVRIEIEIVKAKKIEKMALAALRFYTGKPELDPPDVPIEPEETQVGTLDQYVDAAKANRPELKMLGSAIKVGKANVKLKKASMLPNFVLAGQYTYAYANKVQDQKTPFANDPFNKQGGGVALLLEWPLDIVPAAYRIGKAKADLFRLQAQQQEALGGISVEVELAHGDVLEAKDRMKVLKKGKKLGKGWIIAQSQNFDAGLSEIKDFVDALTTYFEMYLLYYQAVYDFNVALANLRRVSGTDEIQALDGPGEKLE
jgi:outer membrane protein TolC